MHKAVQTPPSRHVVEYMTAMPDALIAFLSQVLGALQSFTVVPSNARHPFKYGSVSNDSLDYDRGNV